MSSIQREKAKNFKEEPLISISTRQAEIEVGKDCLLLDGKEITIYSGEFTYYRIPPADWQKHLQKVKEANCNTISFYIPWNWHEIEEGNFDFIGKTHPSRNLKLFLDMVGNMGFYIQFKPGPAIHNEWLEGGHPIWLLDKHPEIRACGPDRKPIDFPVPPKFWMWPGGGRPVCYLHPTYLEYAQKWLSKVCEVARPYLYTNGGCIILWQIDNEISFYWQMDKPYALDYNPILAGGDGKSGIYQKWLEQKFVEISNLTQQYKTKYKNFTEVEPPCKTPESRQKLSASLDWARFREDIILQYIDKISDMVVNEGVDVPLYLNLPMMRMIPVWKRFAELKKQKHSLLIGPDLYMGYGSPYQATVFTESNIGDLVWTVQGARASQETGPAIGYEIGCAYATHIPASDAEVFYWMMCGAGLDGLNFLHIVGSENPKGYGIFGRSHDWSAPITQDGKVRPHYYPIQRLGAFMETFGAKLQKTRVIADIAIGSYPSMFRAAALGFNKDFREDPKELQKYFINQLMTLFANSSINTEMLYLQSSTAEDLLKHPQIWVFAVDFMDADVQQKLIQYVRNGGHLVMLPMAPILDERMNSCTILNDELFGSKIIDQIDTLPNAVDTKDVEEFWVIGETNIFESPQDSEIIATTSSAGKNCGYTRQIGKGKATLFGFRPIYINDEMKKMIILLVEQLGVKRHAYPTSPNLIVMERATDTYGFLFVISLIEWPLETKLVYTDPRDGFKKTIPQILDHINFTGKCGLVLPIGVPISGTDIVIEYSTSEIIEYKVEENNINLSISGPEGTMGEMALKLNKKPLDITVNGYTISRDNWRWIAQDKIFCFVYKNSKVPQTVQVRLPVQIKVY